MQVLERAFKSHKQSLNIPEYIYPGAMASVVVGGNYERNTDRHGIARVNGSGFIITRRIESDGEQRSLRDLTGDFNRKILDIQYNGSLESWHRFYAEKVGSIFSALDSAVVAVRGLLDGVFAYRVYSKGEAAGFIVNTTDAELNLRRITLPTTKGYVDYPLTDVADAFLVMHSEGTVMDEGSSDLIRLVYNLYNGTVDQAMLHALTDELANRSAEINPTRDASVVAIGMKKRPLVRVLSN